MDPTEQLESIKTRARTQAVGEVVAPPPAPDQLVVGFMHNLVVGEVCYSFEFFPFKDLLDYKNRLLVKPRRTLPWPDDEEYFSNRLHVRFLHSRASDGDHGIGGLYAVGGVEALPFNMGDVIPESLPQVLNHISLSKYRMLGSEVCIMNGGKLFPLLEEIDGLIYILSGPPRPFPPRYKELSENTFEVYDPRDKSLKSLEDLPLVTSPSYISDSFFSSQEYAHLVFGQKLFVSDGVFSCVYDIASNTWSACYLFSDFYTPSEYLFTTQRPMDCGPGFPFKGKALLWKGEYLLCLIPDENAPMAVYRIKKGKGGVEKALPLVLRYEGTLFPYGEGLQLVDIGDDHFALISCLIGELGDECQTKVSIFTFKLEADATHRGYLLVKELNKRYTRSKSDVGSFAYSFTC